MKIVHEVNGGFVSKVKEGHYEVYMNNGNHSIRKGIYHFSNKPDYAFGLAVKRLEVLSGTFEV
ncbi:MAG: hypothetical protein AB7Q04_13440 [Steroidobacteraceae bacterium]